tara:strand:- start:4489 stop:5139 length:651 start_codon:yes stop_codon:yes gene_type:complete
MSFQTIINNATAITVNRRKVTSSTVSRSGILKTAERLPSVYSFTVGMNDGLKYSTNRDLVEELDRLDTTIEEEINIGSTNTGLAYITQYLGNLSASQIGQVTVTSASGNEIVLNTTSVSGSPTGNIFKKGDYIQLDNNYRYPYTVTADVAYSGTSVTVPIHRGFLSQTGYTVSGKGINVGKDVTWRVKAIQNPLYGIAPHDFLVFQDNFVFYEVIT